MINNFYNPLLLTKYDLKSLDEKINKMKEFYNLCDQDYEKSEFKEIFT